MTDTAESSWETDGQLPEPTGKTSSTEAPRSTNRCSRT